MDKPGTSVYVHERFIIWVISLILILIIILMTETALVLFNSNYEKVLLIRGWFR